MNEDMENLQTDGRLLILMQWLKDNDESGAQQREHANSNSTWIPDLLEGPDVDSI